MRGKRAVGANQQGRGAFFAGIVFLVAIAFAIGRLTVPAEEAEIELEEADQGESDKGYAVGFPRLISGCRSLIDSSPTRPSAPAFKIGGLTMLGNASTVEPVAYFGTGTMELVWQDGLSWRTQI